MSHSIVVIVFQLKRKKKKKSGNREVQINPLKEKCSSSLAMEHGKRTCLAKMLKYSFMSNLGERSEHQPSNSFEGLHLNSLVYRHNWV